MRVPQHQSGEECIARQASYRSLTETVPQAQQYRRCVAAAGRGRFAAFWHGLVAGAVCFFGDAADCFGMKKPSPSNSELPPEIHVIEIRDTGLAPFKIWVSVVAQSGSEGTVQSLIDKLNAAVTNLRHAREDSDATA
jgi:hypothetical protein